jgi:outer membrane protein assembly factor BamB
MSDGYSLAERPSLSAGLRLMAGIAAISVLMSCSKDELILEGERIDLRTPLAEASEPLDAVSEPVAFVAPPKFTAPKTVVNSAWPQRNGSAQHVTAHPALAKTLRPLWSVPIGEGVSRKYRIASEPIVSDGRIFTMDSQSTVTAHNLQGTPLWSRALIPLTETAEDVSGGGLALEGNVLIASTAFGELVAMNVESGEEVWAQRLDANFASAPTIFGDLVYGITRDNVAWAIGLKDGRIKWQITSAPSPSGVLGGAAPAVSNDIALFPFSTGEVVATFPKGGVRIWSASLSGRRSDSAYAGITDITSDPVISGKYAYAGNASGRVGKVERANGKVVWTAQEGAYGPVWPAGDSVFLINDQAALVRLSAATGEVLWKKELPYFTEEKIKKRKEIYAHYGPVLAGGRLWVGSSDELLRAFDPSDGGLLAELELPSGATSAPVVVGQTLYIQTRDGQLRAYR